MGYDCKIIVIRKEVTDKWKEKCPDLSISELYSEILWTKSEELYSSSYQDLLQFSEYLSTLENDGVYEFTEESWKEFTSNIEQKLKGVSYYDVVMSEVGTGDYKLQEFMNRLSIAYFCIKEYLFTEDFNKVTILFEHDW